MANELNIDEMITRLLEVRGGRPGRTVNMQENLVGGENI